jgi:hypothetical protein
MEYNKQGSIMSDNYSMTISQDNTNKEILLLSREDEMKSIASQNFIEKNEIEQKEIKNEIEQKPDYTNELNQNTNNNEIKENKEYPLIEKLLNIQKLIKKELSTRKICK